MIREKIEEYVAEKVREQVCFSPLVSFQPANVM
jgi:hypothetical protein